MPKRNNTKKQRASRLLKLIEQGPAFHGITTTEEAKNAYKLWSESWILSEVKDLIPQLKVKEQGEKAR